MIPKPCSKCGEETESLGTAGMMDGNTYHNRHDVRCTKCGNRDDITDCTCDADHCINNFKWHLKHNPKIIDGRKK
ncbi:MAG: hypothetical protein KGI08_07285 [Thaumarchaeota archaeon]|nr:hypothetical protein [Nitrososphaerota archaeon]